MNGLLMVKIVASQGQADWWGCRNLSKLCRAAEPCRNKYIAEIQASKHVRRSKQWAAEGKLVSGRGEARGPHGEACWGQPSKPSGQDKDSLRFLQCTWPEVELTLDQAVVASWRGLTRSNPGRGGAGPREQRGADQRSTAASSTSNLEAGSCGAGQGGGRGDG